MDNFQHMHAKVWNQNVKPIDELSEIEMDTVIRALNLFILHVNFLLHADHMDSATCFTFGKISYARPDQGHEQNNGHVQDN